MKEEFFRHQLVEYIYNRLEAQDYEAFFDEMAKIDAVLLQSWIIEILDQGEVTKADSFPVPDLSSVHQKILKNIYSMDPPKTKSILKLSYWIWASCAALLICVFSILYMVNPTVPRNIVRTQTVTWYQNNYSYTISTQLPDSSIVILYPDARIGFEYNKRGIRAVRQLQGRVIYKVHRNPKVPFQVDFKGYITTALGTIFSVDPQTDEYVRIKLMEGRISVGTASTVSEKLLYLNPKEDVLINLHSHQMVKSSETELTRSRSSRIDKKFKELMPGLEAGVEWTNQSVKFIQTKNSQLLQVIESLYDVSIICESPDLLTNSFTGSLNRKEPLEKFFTTFCQLNGCSFRMDNDIVHIGIPKGREGPQ